MAKRFGRVASLTSALAEGFGRAGGPQAQGKEAGFPRRLVGDPMVLLVCSAMSLGDPHLLVQVIFFWGGGIAVCPRAGE